MTRTVLPEQAPPTESRGAVVEGLYLSLPGNVGVGPFDNALARTSPSAAQGTVRSPSRTAAQETG